MEYKKIYHFHIRKTGGTSINQMFLELVTENSNLAIEKIRNSKTKSAVFSGQKFVSSNKAILEKGDFFYGYSHFSYDQITIPDNTYCFTIFRNPIDRVISHYKMIFEYVKNKKNTHWLDLEKRWLGNSFSDFLFRIPKERLLNQLYMFSNKYDINEAESRVRNLNCYFSLENLSLGVQKLSNDLNISMPVLHKRKSSLEIKIPKNDLAIMRELLDLEYSFLKRLQLNYEK